MAGVRFPRGGLRAQGCGLLVAIAACLTKVTLRAIRIAGRFACHPAPVEVLAFGGLVLDEVVEVLKGAAPFLQRGGSEFERNCLRTHGHMGANTKAHTHKPTAKKRTRTHTYTHAHTHRTKTNTNNPKTHTQTCYLLTVLSIMPGGYC